MRKKIASLIAALLIMACMPLTVFAAETNEMVPVVVQVPNDWEAPHLWAWADDGTNAFEAWPGEEMESLGDGWYYSYVPSFVQNVIVNANNDTEAATQTDSVVVEAGKSVWITVSEDKTATVSYEAQTGEIPEYVEKFVVHAYVPLDWKNVNMWAWSAPDGTNAFEAWPGAAMTEGEDGWFTGKIPTWVNSLIINGNEGAVQTTDISIEAKELWVTVYEDLTYELAYEDPAKAVDNITVYAKVPTDWVDPCCWAWSAPDGTNAFNAWPGEPLTLDGEWYVIETPGWINSVIINGNEGSVQTSDLSVEVGKDVWVVIDSPESASVYYEAPTDAQSETSNSDDVVAETVQEKTDDVANTTDDKDLDGNNKGPIVGVIVGVVALAGGAVVVTKKNKKR